MDFGVPPWPWKPPFLRTLTLACSTNPSSHSYAIFLERRSPKFKRRGKKEAKTGVPNIFWKPKNDYWGYYYHDHDVNILNLFQPCPCDLLETHLNDFGIYI